MDFSKIKNSVSHMTKEMIPVVLGILLALWINNWQKNKDDQAFLSHVFQSIQKEHNENIEELQKVIHIHKALEDSINYYRNDDEVILGQFPQMVGGLRVAIIGNTSWQAFLGNDIRLLDFEKVKLLSTIDEQKSFIKSKLSN